MSRSTARRQGRNCLAGLLALSAGLFVYLFDAPAPAGSLPEGELTHLVNTPDIDIPAEPPALDDLQSKNSEPQTLTGRWAVAMQVLLLERGMRHLDEMGDYSCTFIKQERINGCLCDAQEMSLKLREAPFSVYLKWRTGDKGRELIYVDGQHENKMLVHAGGWKARLLPVLRLDPCGSVAMSEARYPITEVGLRKLIETITEIREADVNTGGYTCEMHDNQEIDGRVCYRFDTHYDSPQVNRVYRKSVLYIEQETGLPIWVKNYTWAKDANPETLDQETLVEFYCYRDIRSDEKLADADFDRTNRAYRFSRR